MSGIPWIGLSGAVPEQKELDHNGWSGVGISIFVKRLVDRVMQAGGGIAMGSHPTFLDDIRDVAITYTRPDEPKRWQIWVGKRYYPAKRDRDEYESKYSPYAEIRWVGKLDPKGPLTDEQMVDYRQAVLSKLRLGFIKASRALVCVGGRPTRRDVERKCDRQSGCRGRIRDRLEIEAATLFLWRRRGSGREGLWRVLRGKIEHQNQRAYPRG